MMTLKSLRFHLNRDDLKFLNESGWLTALAAIVILFATVYFVGSL